jgi:hypothetical protein
LPTFALVFLLQLVQDGKILVRPSLQSTSANLLSCSPLLL